MHSTGYLAITQKILGSSLQLLKLLAHIILFIFFKLISDLRLCNPDNFNRIHQVNRKDPEEKPTKKKTANGSMKKTIFFKSLQIKDVLIAVNLIFHIQPSILIAKPNMTHDGPNTIIHHVPSMKSKEIEDDQE